MMPAHDAAGAAPTGLAWPSWTGRAAPVLAVLALWLLATAWVRPLLLPDEARYAEVAREMLAAYGGDGLVPLLDGLPFFHKPPLTYWVDIAAMRVLGVTPFAARMGPALGAWLMGAALWLALRRRFGARTAGIGLVVLATMPFVYIGGQYANHDMLVAGTISVAVLCFARALERGAPEFGWLLAGWAACAAAVLSKGLIGVVLPALVVGPWLLVLGRWRDLLRLLHPAGLALFALLTLPWFVLMQVRYPGFFDYFVVEQHFRRYATQNFNNVQPFWFYLWVLPVLTLPWGGWLVTLWRPLRALARRGLRGLDGDDGGWTLLMLWWTAAILGFFTLPASKLVGYIMPALLPGAALLAPVLARRPAWRPTAAVAALVCIAVVVLLAWKSPHSGRDVGQALRAQLRPDDRVVMVEATFHDVAFEARLTRPPLIASNWADPDLRKFDNWRKELADAARFAPEPERAVLLQIDELPRLPCRGTQRTWIVAEHAAEGRAAAVPGAVQVMRGQHLQLWRAEPRACTAGS